MSILKKKEHYDTKTINETYVNSFLTLEKAINNVFSEYNDFTLYFNKEDKTNNDLIIDFYNKKKVLKLKVHIMSFSTLYLDRNINDYISLLNDLKAKIRVI